MTFSPSRSRPAQKWFFCKTIFFRPLFFLNEGTLPPVFALLNPPPTLRCRSGHDSPSLDESALLALPATANCDRLLVSSTADNGNGEGELLSFELPLRIYVLYKAAIQVSGYRLGCASANFPTVWNFTRVALPLSSSLPARTLLIHRKDGPVAAPCDPSTTFVAQPNVGPGDISAVSGIFVFEIREAASGGGGGEQQQVSFSPHKLNLYEDRSFGLSFGQYGACSEPCGSTTATQSRKVVCAHGGSGEERYHTLCGIQDESVLKNML